jgi:hypothetical protein
MFEGRDTVIGAQVRFIERLLNTKPYLPEMAESMFEQSLHARMLLSAAEEADRTGCSFAGGSPG